MGREIVRLESPEKPRARSRLWLAKDIVEVLQEDGGSSKIQLINLECDYNGNVIEWDGLALTKMEKLRTLIIKKGRFSQGPKHLPSSLRVLKLEMHPSQEYLSFYFHPKQLVIFDLSRNCFDSVQVAKLLKRKFENMRVLRFDHCERITKIPNLSNAPKLEELSFACCPKLTEIDESVGSLDKLKTLNAVGCSQLRSLPPLMLPSLETLSLSYCSSLESFPEILGKMESVTDLSLREVPIKKLPYSIHNLTRLRSLALDRGRIVELPSSITLLEEVETLYFSDCKGLLLPNQDEGEEQMSSMATSHTTDLDIYHCNVSEEFLRRAIPVFPSLGSLHLRNENFRILPKCIEEFRFLRELHLIRCTELEEIRGIPPNIEELLVEGCRSLSLLTSKCIEEFQFLRKLHLIDCEKLEEIRGIPPNIEELFVVGRTSLTPSTREMLLNKKLHEEGQDKMFILPEPAERLPEWFEYRRRDLSIAFWFRNKFPAISFGLFIRGIPLDHSRIRLRLTINGVKSFQLVAKDFCYFYFHEEVGRILIFSKTQTTFRDQVGEALSEDGWKRAVIAVYDDEPFDRNELDCVEVGLHIIEEKSCMDDIRDVGYSHEAHTQLVQQQTYPDPFVAHQRDFGRRHSNSKEMSSTTTTLNVQALPSTSFSIISSVPLKIEEHPIELDSRVSFDTLEEVHQQILLDIACCQNRYRYELKAVKEMLQAYYGVSVEECINILVEKSLIKIEKNDDNADDDDDYVTVHELIRDMSREIVCLESPNEPGARSRLWLDEEIIEVLQQDKGSSKIQVINLEFDDSSEVIEWDGLAFKKMENLRTLIIRECQFSQFPKYLPSSLRVLKLEIDPSLEILPFDFQPKELVIFELSGYCFDSVQVAELLEKKFENMRVLKFDDCGNITKIPNLSSAPKLEVLSFRGCYKLTEIDESVGSLDKLKILDALGCDKLRSLPPLMLPSLERLELDGCSSLESFPEILGKMECMMHLFLSSYHIKKFPCSIHNLTGLQSLSLESCGAVELPSGIMLPGVETLSFYHCKGLLLPIQDEGEEQVSSMPFSSTTHLDICECNISEEFLRLALPLFPRLQSLRLTRENFRILPECIREFQFLRLLDVTDCMKLEEIRGIPPNIEELYACRCRSLSSLTTGMLLSKKLYEEGQDKTFILPGKSLPVWFEHQRRESSITFWFRNKFPAISFGVLNPSTAFNYFIRAKLTINGTKSFPLVQCRPYCEEGRDHGLIFIFSKTETFRDQVDEALSENEWNDAVFSVYYYEEKWWHRQKDLGCTVGVGVHIIEERSSMDDISFTDPLPSTLTTLNVQGCGTASRKRKRITPMLDLKNDPIDQSNNVIIEAFEERIEDSFNEAEEQSSIRKRKASSSVKTPAKIQKTTTEEDVLTVFSKNQEKNSDVEVLETTIVPTSISEANRGSYESSIRAENAGQSLNSLIEIQPLSLRPLDPLVELERLLLGSYDTSESNSPFAAYSADIQASEVVIILQNLEPLLDNPLESLVADGEIKHQILDCLSKLGQLEDHIPIPLQSIVEQVRDFYEDLIHNFPSIQQTLVDYSCLEETRSKFLENLKQAKVKQAQIDAEVSREKVQVEELDAEIADLEIKLKAAVENQNKLQLAIKNGEAEKNKILEDASAWLLESKQVVRKIKSSEHAYRDAQNSKARLEERLAKLRGPFAEVRSCPYESSIHSENVDQPMNSLIEIHPPSPQPLDPLAELERVLLGSYDGSPESTAASCSEIQSSEVCIILQNLKPSLDNPLEILIAEGEIKLQIMDCLSKLVQLEDHIPMSLQSIVAEVRDFYEDLIHSFPSIQQTLVDYSRLEETRSNFLESLKQAKVKQARIEARVSREKNQLDELAAGIADSELKLKAAVKKQNELQLAIKNGEAEKNKILEDASAWLTESKQVVKKMRSSEHAYRDAQNSKARLEGRLAKLKGAFAANKP